MDEQTSIERGLVREKGITLEIPLSPKDKVTIALNDVIAKTIEVDNWTTMQIKTWQTIKRT